MFSRNFGFFKWAAALCMNNVSALALTSVAVKVCEKTVEKCNKICR